MVTRSAGKTSMTLGELFASIAAVDPLLASIEITGVQLDSRAIREGDLYLALRGATTHGILHAADAVQRGARAVAVDATDDVDLIAQVADGTPLIKVPDLARRAGPLAGRLHGHPDRTMCLLAVTGTDGKTSVCRFIAAALESLGTRCGYIGTLGWGLGDSLESTALTTPDATALVTMLATLREQGAQAVALEASSHGLATGRLDGLDLDVGVLTNFGRDHLDYHGDLENYRRAKAALFEWPTLTAAVLNGNDALGRALDDSLQSRRPEVERYVFRREADETSRIAAESVQATPRGLSFMLVDGDTRRAVDSALIGRFNVDNLLACHGALRALGHSPEEAAGALAGLKPVAGRMERFAAEDRPTVIVDYAHTPQALSAAIDAARAHCAGVLWVVFGCGGDRDRGKRAPMGKAAEAADRIVVTDDNPRRETSADIIAAVLQGMEAPGQATVIADRASAIAHAVRCASADDLVLIAGKGHEDYQIVGDQRLAFSDRDCVDALLAEAC